jgi:C4-dicarboxylate transporter DctQ subunit
MAKQTPEKAHHKKSSNCIGRLTKIFDYILQVTAYFSGTLIIILMLSIVYEVVMRYFFNSPTSWVIDFSGYMQYAIVMLGAAWVLKRNGHTKIDILSVQLRGKKETILNAITSSIGFLTCAVFFWEGLTATWEAYQRHEFLYREVEIPVAPLFVVFPISFFLLCIQFAREIYNYLRSL